MPRDAKPKDVLDAIRRVAPDVADLLKENAEQAGVSPDEMLRELAVDSDLRRILSSMSAWEFYQLLRAVARVQRELLKNALLGATIQRVVMQDMIAAAEFVDAISSSASESAKRDELLAEYLRAVRTIARAILRELGVSPGAGDEKDSG